MQARVRERPDQLRRTCAVIEPRRHQLRAPRQARALEARRYRSGGVIPGAPTQRAVEVAQEGKFFWRLWQGWLPAPYCEITITNVHMRTSVHMGGDCRYCGAADCSLLRVAVLTWVPYCTLQQPFLADVAHVPSYVSPAAAHNPAIRASKFKDSSELRFADVASVGVCR